MISAVGPEARMRPCSKKTARVVVVRAKRES